MDEREVIRRMWRGEYCSTAQLVTPGAVPRDVDLVVVCRSTHRGIIGARQARCECGAIIWVTPTVQAVVDKHPKPARLLCCPCGAAKLPKLMSLEVN